MAIHTNHPTDHAAFRGMVKEMDIVELECYLKIINNDIIKYIQSYGDKRHAADTREYTEKLKIVSEEIKMRRQLKLELEVA